MTKRSSIDNTYLFSFDHADIIRDTAAKAGNTYLQREKTLLFDLVETPMRTKETQRTQSTFGSAW